MRRKILTLCLTAVASLAIMVGTSAAGSAQDEPEVIPLVVQCLNWHPPGVEPHQCASSPYAGTYTNVWYSTGSYARRTQVGWRVGTGMWGPGGCGTLGKGTCDGTNGCLTSGARVTHQYRRQDGSIMWQQTSPWGSCGQDIAANSGQTYVKVFVMVERPAGRAFTYTRLWSYWY